MKRITSDLQKRLAQNASASVTVSRREWALIGVVLLVAVVLRIIALSRSAVEHFDEGVYASNVYFGPPDYAYPQQRFFGPPLLPALIETCMIGGSLVGLPPNCGALLPSFLAGCATIVALWWFGRSWFGPEVGISAATLAALSDFHILYSATALTDVLLGLWLVLAVDAIGRSLLQQDLRWAIGAGIFTGLAWWTKYNGWLPLAIEAAALPLLCWFLRPGRNQLLAWLTSFVATVATAAAVWTPYYLWLQSHGGYGPIAANHAKYVVGISGWLDAAARQLSNQYCIEGWTTIVGVVAAIVLPAVIFARGREQAGVALFMGVAVGYMAIQFTSFVGVIVWALPGLVCVLWSVDRSQLAEPAEKRRVVAGVLVFFWFAGLALLTPLYWPYPRLALPALCAAWIGTAICVAEGPLKGLTIPGWFSRSSWHLNGLLMFLALVVVLLALAKPDVKKVHLSGERRGIQTIATQIVAENKLGDPRVVYVYGEPALFFQLRAAGEPIVAPVQDVPTEPATIDGKPVATFLVVGPHAESDSQFQQQWKAAEERWALLKTLDYQPSAVAWLDLHDARKPEAGKMEHSIRLYRFRE